MTKYYYTPIFMDRKYNSQPVKDECRRYAMHVMRSFRMLGSPKCCTVAIFASAYMCVSRIVYRVSGAPGFRLCRSAENDSRLHEACEAQDCEHRLMYTMRCSCGAQVYAIQAMPSLETGKLVVNSTDHVCFTAHSLSAHLIQDDYYQRCRHDGRLPSHAFSRSQS